MKYKSILALLISSALLFSGCSAGGNSQLSSAPAGSQSVEESGAQTDAYHKIDAAQAKKMIDAGGVIVVDVRRADEYAQKHIPGALLVPNESIGETSPEQLPDLNATLLVHCRTGVRSKQASEKLIKIGYKNVYDFGGIVDWPYETEAGEVSN